MTWRVIHADCLEAMAEMAENSIDAVVTDPPYGLHFMGKTWDKFGGPTGRDNTKHSQRGGAMHAGKYDLRLSGQQGFQLEAYSWGVEMLRVLKPGGHLAIFGGTRTYHRLTCALEDAGFEIRDCLAFMYGSGFPKSLNVSKDERFCQGHEGDSTDGESPTEHDVRPVLDVDVSAPVSATRGQGALLLAGVSEPSASQRRGSRFESEVAGSEQSSVEGRGDVLQATRQLHRGPVRASAGVGVADGAEGWLRDGASPGDRESGAADAHADGSREPRRPQPVEQRPGEPRTLADEPGPQARGVREVCTRCGKPLVAGGLGTALKPAFEPIVLARKPLAARNVAANVLEYGTGAINVDGCRIEAPENVGKTWTRGGNQRGASLTTNTSGEHQYVESHPAGRWPANVVLDEDAAAALDEMSGERPGNFATRGESKPGQVFGFGNDRGDEPRGYGDRGGASRFFYTSKSGRAERERGMAEYGEVVPVGVANSHPT